jgi:hypothetical protein
MGTGNIGFPGLNRLSSSEERTAHNREVTGSTPVGGIFPIRGFTEPAGGTAPLNPLLVKDGYGEPWVPWS